MLLSSFPTSPAASHALAFVRSEPSEYPDTFSHSIFCLVTGSARRNLHIHMSDSRPVVRKPIIMGVVERCDPSELTL